MDGSANDWHFVHLGSRAVGGAALVFTEASAVTPWKGHAAIPTSAGGWEPVGPTGDPFSTGYPVPRALDAAEIPAIVQAFKDAARRALAAGFDVIELHAAHGYLIHQFLSPLSNTRTDQFGGSFDNRIRLCLEVVDGVRSLWPERLPMFMRISATDWVDGGWDVEQSIALCRRLRDHGVDVPWPAQYLRAAPKDTPAR